MKLNSPRQDPYSSINNTLDSLRKKGYTEEFIVQDEKIATDSKGNEYKAEDLFIDEVHRITGQKNWFNQQDKATDRMQQVFALNAKNGVKGTINNDLNEEGFETVELFLQNVDRNDELNENYTS